MGRMSNLSLTNLEQQVQQLPSLSLVVNRVLTLLQRKDVTVSILVAEIQHDQGLTVNILRIANSPFYGLSTRIDNLGDAITLLGLSTLQCIIMAVGVIGHFPPSNDRNFNSHSFWLHAIGTGSCARVLALYVGLDAEKAFTVGLLHDIGKVVLAAYFEDDFAQVLAFRDQQDCLIRTAEHSVLGFDHTDIGALVARHWKMPTIVVDAIAWHHKLPSEGIPFAELVHVADIVCRGLDIGHGGDDLIPVIHPEALSKLGLNYTDLQEALPEIERITAKAGMLLDRGPCN